MKITKIIISFMALGMISACGRSSFETEPVRLSTPRGDVYCQLYTTSSVRWDTSISRPSTMSEAEANQLCVNKGYEIKRNSQ